MLEADAPLLTVEAMTCPGLDPVSFRLAAGECLAVRGPSGSGKTLLLRALADLDPNAGEVRLEDVLRESVPAPDWRCQVAYVPVESGWWTDRVLDHFDDWAGAREMLDPLHLPAAIGEAMARQLSTGERQRLALVRALLRRPRILLLDEPTAALDDAATAAVESLIRDRLEAGCGALWVTHDGAQARRLARRALWIEMGQTRITEA